MTSSLRRLYRQALPFVLALMTASSPLHSATLFWNEASIGGSIMTASTDSPAAIVKRSGVTDFFSIVALATDTQRLFWTENGNTIWTAPVDGGSAARIVINQEDAFGLAVHEASGKIYWTEPWVYKVRRANYDGTGKEDVFTHSTGPESIAIDETENKIYWTDSGQDLIQRANLDGTSVETLYDGELTPRGIVVDPLNDHVYWLAQEGSILRMNRDGSGQTELISDLDFPTALALAGDVNRVYWIESGISAIRSVRWDGSDPQTFRSSGSLRNGLAIESVAQKIDLPLPSVNPDLNFPNDNWDETFVRKTQILPDRSILYAGDGWFGPAIGRLLEDGTPDPDFYTHHELSNDYDASPPRILDFARLASGEIVVVGSFTEWNDQPRNGVALLSPDGYLSFNGIGSGSGFDGPAYAVEVDENDRIYIPGTSGIFAATRSVKSYAFTLTAKLMESSPRVPTRLMARSSKSNWFEYRVRTFSMRRVNLTDSMVEMLMKAWFGSLPPEEATSIFNSQAMIERNVFLFSRTVT